MSSHSVDQLYQIMSNLMKRFESFEEKLDYLYDYKKSVITEREQEEAEDDDFIDDSEMDEEKEIVIKRVLPKKKT